MRHKIAIATMGFMIFLAAAIVTASIASTWRSSTSLVDMALEAARLRFRQEAFLTPFFGRTEAK